MPLRLEPWSLSFPDGVIAGVVGPDGSGKSRMLRAAAEAPGGVLVEFGARTLEAALAGSPRVLALNHALAVLDAAAQSRATRQIERLRRQGSIVLVASHDLALLERICDIVVALEEGRVVEQGDPGLVLGRYRRRMIEQIRAETGGGEASASSRHGDRRAEVAGIEIIGENGQPVTTVRSGEKIAVRLTLRFHQAVEAPVAGILIRNRIGVGVYGTNTELEKVEIGARRAGETAVVDFEFVCDLCPQEYSVTAASHDPDGTAHDWLEEALLFSVVDERYTAGVANLRARVKVR